MVKNTRPQLLMVALFLVATLFLCPYSSALDSMSIMHSSSRCNLPAKQANYPYVNWGASDVQAGISNLYNQFKSLSNSNDYVYCSLLGYLVIMIKTAFDKRQCGNGDSFCYYPSGVPSGNYPACNAYFCSKNPNSYCNGIWGNGQCRVLNNKCFLNCMKFKINWSTTGWSMFSSTFSDKFWQVNGNLYWNKRDLEFDRNNTAPHLHPPPEHEKQEKRPLTISHLSSTSSSDGEEISKDTRSEDDKKVSRSFRMLKNLLERYPQRRMNRRQAILSSCGECGCSWATSSCSDCDNGWLAMGTPCTYYGLCCQCWMIS